MVEVMVVVVVRSDCGGSSGGSDDGVEVMAVDVMVVEVTVVGKVGTSDDRF